MNNYNELNEACAAVPEPNRTQVKAILFEQHEMICELLARLGAIDREIGFPATYDVLDPDKADPNMINFLIETNRMISRCLDITINISINIGVDDIR